jgi:DNA-binding NtrC family response regulator
MNNDMKGNHLSNDPASARRASIVVVDPNPISLLALAGALNYQSYSCICARTAAAALEALKMGIQDLVVWDVADDAPLALDTLAQMRSQNDHEGLAAVFLADSKWAGLEKKAEALPTTTRCLFKPIDPNVLITIVDQALWMPSLVQTHRRRGSRPSRPGWVTL